MMGPMIWTALALVAMWHTPVPATGNQSSVETLAACSCQNEVTVSLDETCGFLLTLPIVGQGDCESTYRIIVNDPNPGNGAIVDCKGRWSYAVVTSQGQKVCGGTVIAIDAIGPQLTAWEGRQDVLWCSDLSAVLNKSESYTNPAYAFFTGTPVFEDNCSTCGCNSIHLNVKDRVEYLSCQQSRSTGIYARIYRDFQGKDCQGNTTQVTQEINFIRPDWRSFTTVETLRVSACSVDNIPGGLKSVIREALSIPHPYHPLHPMVSLLDLSCGFSIGYTYTAFGGCSNGQVLLVDIAVMDQCGQNLGRHALKIIMTDQEAPQIDYTNRVFTIPTGPGDCTASLPLDLQTLRQRFGLRVTDNCTANPLVSFRVESRGSVIGGFGIPGVAWQETNYPRINQGGRITLTGLPALEHRLIIQAEDACGNVSQEAIYFIVQDQTPPNVVCDDQINVTLTTSVGLGQGEQIAYASVSVADVDEGTTDNCLLTQLAVYRIVEESCLSSFLDNPDYDLDGNGDVLEHFTRINSGPHAGRYQTPALDYVEFFCCDAGRDIPVILVASDAQGNTSSCESLVRVTDNSVPKVISLPQPVSVSCLDYSVRADLLNQDKADQRFGKPTFTGAACQDLPLEYSVDSVLHCGSGYYRRHWQVRKTIQGRETVVDLGSQIITVLPVHEYSIYFPADVVGTCETPDGGGVVLSEMGCDVLAVNISDSPYTTSNEACQQIFRTYTVINWCEFSEWEDQCTDQLDPLNFAQVVPRFWDQNHDGDTRDTFDIPVGHGRWLLIRDRENTHTQYSSGKVGAPNGIEEIYLSIDQEVNPQKRVFPYKHPEGNIPGGHDSTFVFDDISIENYCLPLTNAYGNKEHVPTFAWQYTQLLRWQDTLAPTITALGAPFLKAASPQSCTGTLEATFNVSDNCTAPVIVENIRVAPGQGTSLAAPTQFQAGWTAPEVVNAQLMVSIDNLPLGIHDLEISLRDNCGNRTTRRFPFTIQDATGPDFSCRNELTVNILPATEGGDPYFELTAYDLILAPGYDCSGQDTTARDPAGRPLVTHYSINRVGEPVDSSQHSLIVGCADNGSSFSVEIHAWDLQGNQQFCSAVINVGELGDACKPPFPDSLLVGGQVYTETGYAVPDVRISLSRGMLAEIHTDNQGAFLFDSLSPGFDYTLRPDRDGDDMFAISTYDLVLIQKHILGITPLESPYQIIAADVNGNGEVTVADLVQLRRLILGIIPDLPDNRSWRFVDAAHAFPNRMNPWQEFFPEVINLNNLAQSRMDADFVAIKIGDVSGNAGAELAGGGRLVAESPWPLEILAPPLKLPGAQKIPVRLPDLNRLDGVQFALNWNTEAIQITEVLPAVADSRHWRFDAEQGQLLFSWHPETPDDYQLIKASDTLFWLQLTDGLLSPKVINLSADELAGEAYQNGTLYTLTMSIPETIPERRISARLGQNVPNPWVSTTTIPFFVPAAGQVTIRLTDLLGRPHYQTTKMVEAGTQELQLTRNMVPGSGIYRVTLLWQGEIVSRTLILQPDR